MWVGDLSGRLHKLKALQVSRLKEPGRYPDGGGLYLQIGRTGTKSWLYRFMLHGKAREMGLGSLDRVSLETARKRAAECRQQHDDGIDPIEARDAKRAAAQAETAKSLTFTECAEGYIQAQQAGWRNAKHADQWRNTLKAHVTPVFGSLPVRKVDQALVMAALRPIWTTKPETASRVRGRIEAILDWATVSGYRSGDNPARWRGHLQKLLAKPADVRAVEHHPALSYDDVGVFVANVRRMKGIAAQAVEFLIFTAARTSEVVGARWTEIDLERRIWTIPANRIKARREHRVPLSPPAIAILTALAKIRESEFVFPGGKSNTSLSNMALLGVLKRMKRTDITIHGFRSTFRDWAAERTSYPSEVAEMALAHAVGDKVEAAYRRGDLFEKRHGLMRAWAKHCERVKSGNNVVPISAAKADGAG